MNNYKVGDKVETPLGIGNITFIGNWNIWVSIDGLCVS